MACDRTLIVKISCVRFFGLYVDFADDFGLFMSNLAPELSRQVAMLENVIGKSAGWSFDLDDRLKVCPFMLIVKLL